MGKEEPHPTSRNTCHLALLPTQKPAGGNLLPRSFSVAPRAFSYAPLSNEERMQFDMQFTGHRKSPTTALILGLFLGTLGIDRFYIGNTGLGVAKLLTLGGLWIWQIIDWFLIMGATRRHNLEVAQQIQVSITQMRPSNAASAGG